jgi:hypothetical protein
MSCKNFLCVGSFSYYIIQLCPNLYKAGVDFYRYEAKVKSSHSFKIDILLLLYAFCANNS